MWHLGNFGLSDMVQMGAALRKVGVGCKSMEALGQATARFLFTNLLGKDGAPALALARVFKTHAYETLPPDLQDSATAMMHPVAPWRSLRCLTLLGTAGENADWNSRHSSRGHKAIPLQDAASVNGAPMVAGLARQLGVDVGALVKPTPELFLEQATRTFNVFHVEDAFESPLVPGQEFVHRHGIRSVLGLGGLLPTGEIFAAIMFSKCTLPAAMAPLFKPLALSLRSSVLQTANRVFA